MNTIQFGDKIIEALSDDRRKQILRILVCGPVSISTLREALHYDEALLLSDLVLLSSVRVVEAVKEHSTDTWKMVSEAETLIKNFLVNNHLPSSEEFCSLIR